MNTVRDLRNASAHSNCLINKLFEPLNPNQQIDSSISNYVKSVASVSSQARAKNLNYRIVYNFVTLLYIYDSIIPDGIAKCKRHAEIKDLFNNRMTKHKDYFKSNNIIVGIYMFLKKVVDTLPSWTYNYMRIESVHTLWKEWHIRKVLSLLIFIIHIMSNDLYREKYLNRYEQTILYGAVYFVYISTD